MKAWFIALPLVCMVSVAMAGGAEKGQKDQPAGQTQAGSIHHKAHHRMHTHRMKHFPKHDMRACLDLKDNKAIIRCSESRRKR
jgi:hypothetical protein